jgi:acyl-CoA dehydrogenase
MVMDIAVPEEMRDVIKGTIDGLQSFIDTEVVPVEEEYKEILEDERKMFRDDGILVDEIADARTKVRMKSAQAGFYTMLVPEEIGGGGLPWVAAPFILESLYRRYGPGRIFITWAAGFLTSPLIASFVDGPSHMFTSTSEAVQKEVMPSLMSGEKTVCFGVTEPDAGSDLWGLKTKARRDGDDWVINGSKQWITNAPYASWAAIFAVTNEEVFKAHKGGIGCFLVDTGAPGYAPDKINRIMGHVSSDCAGMSLDNVRVTNDYALGDVEQGFRVAMFGISEGRMGIAAGCVGMSEWGLDRALEYAQQRRTFGVPLAEHQAIQFMLAECAIDIFTAKQTVVHTARLLDAVPTTGRLPVKEISISKAYAVETAERVLDRAIQIHGGMGLSSEMALEEGFRIARTLRIPDGTAEIQRRTIARQLLRGDTVF